MSKSSKSSLCALLVAAVLSTLSYAAAPDRISGALSSGQTVPLAKSVHPKARAQYDQGPIDPLFKLGSMTLLTAPSAAQQKALNKLLAQQQDPTSPSYHKWLTPAQYADRFGLSQNDLNRVTAWLKAQGFAVQSVAGGRNAITFSGTAVQVQSAFKAEIHRYNVEGEEHFANSTPLMVPAALNGIVTGILGVNNFRMRPASGPKLRPAYYDNNFLFPNFLGPADVATIYDIPSTLDGTGEKLAIVGETDIYLADINDFRSGFGLQSTPISCTTNTSNVITACDDPHFKYVLYLPSGATDPGAPNSIQDDLGEADLDLEWSGGVAPNAQIVYVNAPSPDGNGVNDALITAINPPSGPPAAPVISMSYGICEAEAVSLETYLQQGAAEGVTVVNSTGDSGAAACDNLPPNYPSFPFTPATGGLTVNYPASSAYVVAAGGTSISLANDSYPSPSSYWNTPTTNPTNGGTAKSYIPEQAWNDDEEFAAYCAAPVSGDTFCSTGNGTTGWISISSPPTGTTAKQAAQEDIWISAGGGGASNCFTENPDTGICSGGVPQPTWQSTLTVSGAPAGVRWLPDVSFMASPEWPGYIFCTELSELGDSGTGSSCANGIAGALSTSLANISVVGGTSVSAPVFAGIVTLLNQSLPAAAPLGDIHPMLYKLAKSTAGTATPAFHQVTTGDNMVYCQPGTPSGQPSNILCPAAVSPDTAGIFGYSATNYDSATGYNLVTGLGSVDVNNLATAWATVAAPFTLTPPSGTLQVTQGQSINAQVTLTLASGFSGTVTFACPSPGSEMTCTPPPATNASGTVTFVVATTAPTASLRRPFDRGTRIFYAVLLPGLVGIVFTFGSRKRSLAGMRMLGLIMVLGFSTLWLGSCGGSSGGTGNPGTPKGNYTINISGTSGSTTVKSSFQISVQ